jgi:hypothetical protein
MKFRSYFIAAGIVAIVLFGILKFNFSDPNKQIDVQGSPMGPQEKRAPLSVPDSADSADMPDPNDPRLTRLKEGRVEFNPALGVSRTITPTMPEEERLSVLSEIFNFYRLAYKENPVGVDNFEFTEQLLGKNRMSIVFIAPDCAALRGNELVDEWGTPYFFHPVSSEVMEMISAGPDREMWTSDDVSLGNPSP